MLSKSRKEMTDKDLVKITQEYYNSKEADAFYFYIWGGEDIHIGIYDDNVSSIKEASRKAILAMLKKLPAIKKSHKILDIGSGYGGAARFLASQYNCRVDCLNLSETENERNREMTRVAGLEDFISITTGNFESLPFKNESYDFIWCQDALLHSNQKYKVFLEVTRTLKHGGRFIFTDPMQSDNCPKGVLKNVLARIHLQELGSVSLYEKLAKKAYLEKVLVKEMPEQLVNHYSAILTSIQNNYQDIIQKSNAAYIERMIEGLKHWIEAGEKGFLNWGILQFQKRNS